MARAPAQQEDEALPEADRLEGFLHPRETPTLVGHEAAELELAQAFAGGRMHHAWLIAGPGLVFADRIGAEPAAPDHPLALSPAGLGPAHRRGTAQGGGIGALGRRDGSARRSALAVARAAGRGQRASGSATRRQRRARAL